jgi:hypothetical protein
LSGRQQWDVLHDLYSGATETYQRSVLDELVIKADYGWRCEALNPLIPSDAQPDVAVRCGCLNRCYYVRCTNCGADAPVATPKGQDHD